MAEELKSAETNSIVALREILARLRAMDCGNFNEKTCRPYLDIVIDVDVGMPKNMQ